MQLAIVKRDRLNVEHLAVIAPDANRELNLMSARPSYAHLLQYAFEPELGS